MVKVYGIANCTAVRTARAWLDEQCIAYTFVDFRKTPPTAAQLAHWPDSTNATMRRCATA